MATDDKKLSRKEIKAPDAFQKATADLSKGLMENQKAVYIALGVIVALVVIFAIASQMGARRTSEGGGALAKALETARRPVAGSMDPSTDPTLPEFSSRNEKYETLVKQLEEVRQQFPDSDAAHSARYYIADAQFQLGNYDAAISNYEGYLASAQQGSPLKVLALEGLGYSYEEKKDYAKAADAFARMKQEAGESYKDRAAYHQARMLELEGKKEEAAAAFQQIKVDFKDSPVTRAAIDRLALLSAQGVPLPPEPEPAGEEGSPEAAK